MFRRALAIEEKILGADHPDAALACNNLGVVLQSQNRTAEARALFARALAILRAALGDDHPKTLMVKENLG